LGFVHTYASCFSATWRGSASDDPLSVS